MGFLYLHKTTYFNPFCIQLDYINSVISTNSNIKTDSPIKLVPSCLQIVLNLIQQLGTTNATTTTCQHGFLRVNVTETTYLTIYIKPANFQT